MKLKISQIREEIIENLLEQIYNNKFDICGLALIGLFELEKDFIKNLEKDLK